MSDRALPSGATWSLTLACVWTPKRVPVSGLGRDGAWGDSGACWLHTTVVVCLCEETPTGAILRCAGDEGAVYASWAL